MSPLFFILVIAYVACVSAVPVPSIQISLFSLASGSVPECLANQFISSSVVKTMQCVQNPTSSSSYITVSCSNGAAQVTQYADAACTTVGTITQYSSTSCSSINNKAVAFTCNYVPSNSPIPVLNMGPNTANPGSVLIATGSCPMSLLDGTLASTMYFPTGTCINASNDPQQMSLSTTSRMFWCNGNSVVSTGYSDEQCRVQSGMAMQYDIGVCYNGMQVLQCNGARAYDGVTTNTNTPPALYMYEDPECSEVGSGQILTGGGMCTTVSTTVGTTTTYHSYLFQCQGSGSASYTVALDTTFGQGCFTGAVDGIAPVSVTPNVCMSLPYPIPANGNTVYTNVKIDCGGGVGLSLAGSNTVSSSSSITPLPAILIATIVMGIVGVFRL